jgi:hypothetical protein
MHIPPARKIASDADTAQIIVPVSRRKGEATAHHSWVSHREPGEHLSAVDTP